MLVNLSRLRGHERSFNNSGTKFLIMENFSKTKSFPQFSNWQLTTGVLTLVVLFLVLASPVFALDTGLEFGRLTGLSSQDIRITIMKIIRVILGLVGLTAIIIIMYGGYVWMTSGGNAEKVDTAKRILRNAVIGLIIIFSAFAIVSFIIRQLEFALGIRGGGGGQPGACENCGHLGAGIIERVYPEPGARNVVRNTNIMVTFKVNMKPDTIIKPDESNPGCASLPCAGQLDSNNVKIYRVNDTETGKLNDNQVTAATQDGKTFVFTPLDYLGDGLNSYWYAVKLTNGIKKDNNQSAFPGFNNFFLWRFEVGTKLDLDPVETSNVFPQPDNESDTYTISPAVKAAGLITVLAPPAEAEAADVTEETNEGSAPPLLPVTPTYTCANDYFVCVSSSNGTNFTISPKDEAATNCNALTIANSGFNETAIITGAKTLNIGCGLTLSFDGEFSGGVDQWHFKVQAAKTADTLRVDNKVYIFGNEADQINSSDNLAQTTANIAEKISSDNSSLRVEVTPSDIISGTTINLEAKTAGAVGNNITLLASNGWANISPFAGGRDRSIGRQINNLADKARNAAIVIDFNETINPLNISQAITVYYDSNLGVGETWTLVPGQFFVSNQYQTVEFLSNQVCEVNGSAVTNSCGDPIFCLPVNKRGTCSVTIDQQCDINADCPSGETCGNDEYQATHYRVIIKAGLLEECTSDADCTDPNFKQCIDSPGTDTAKICSRKDDNTGNHYPRARTAALGITDAANNSFNGNFNTYTSLGNQIYGKAEGPGYLININEVGNQSGWEAYNWNLNPPQDDKGDDLIWTFYINQEIDLSPSDISEISPDVSSLNNSLTEPIAATFNELMLTSSLKPGSNYRDGQCFCDPASDATNNCPTGQVCDPVFNRCKAESGQPPYCLENSECPNNDGKPDNDPKAKQCLNKKYVSLVDWSTTPVGWWITKDNLDVLPKDNFADLTQGKLRHTIFAEVTNYGAEFGSGIKDVYQNCFLPSEGPRSDNTNNGSCNTTAAEPYCCNGVAMNQTEWQGSACFTGY